jgi:hypothetical protein
MILQSVTDLKEAAEMSQRIMEITMKGFGPNGCTIILADGQTIPKARLVSVNAGNNGGKNGLWSYYGSVTVETDGGNNYVMDASLIKQVI